MRLTPDTLVAAYDFLRTTAPFKGWGLPDSDAIEFCVTHSEKFCGSCHYTVKSQIPYRIDISERANINSFEMLCTMAHEMCHVHQRLTAHKTKYPSADHGRIFIRLAKQVCRAHGWDMVDIL